MNFVDVIAKRGKKIWFATSELFRKDYLKPIFVFSFFFIVLEIVYFSIDRLVSLDDPMFHIRFAEIIRERGFGVFKDFHWIYPLDVSTGGDFNYYNFLFYVALIPFTYIKPLVLGLKLYGVVFFSLSLTILYYFLKNIKVNHPFLWVMLFLSLANYTLINRFLVVRSFSLAPILLILELYYLYKGKYSGVFVISLAYFYWHNATFIFPLVISIVYFISEKFYGKKTDLRPILYSVSAILISSALALLYSRDFFSAFYTIFDMFNETIIKNKVAIAEGSELYPVDFYDYFRSNMPIISLYLASIIFEICQYIQRRRANGGSLSVYYSREQILKMSLFVLSLAFFAGIFYTRRLEDFFVFFSICYIAISFNEMLRTIDFGDKIVKKSVAATLAILCGYLFMGNLLFFQDRIASQRPYDAIKGAAEWLKNNTEEKEIIFYPTWNWFTILFYYNTHNYYIIGLEPRVLYDFDNELYWGWWNISTNGYLCTKDKCDDKKEEKRLYLKGDKDKEDRYYENEGNLIADYIRSNFHSRYIVTSGAFQNLNAIMEKSKRFEKVFTDNTYREYYIYEVR